MKNQELFNRTISILVKAYLNNTLEHTNCYACAVQNLVAGNMGLKIIPKPINHEVSDCDHISVIIPNMKYIDTLTINLDSDKGIIKPKIQEQLKATGYTRDQLREIEFSFEYYSFDPEVRSNTEEWVFQGLMSVCDCLMEIHEATAEETQHAKELFVRA